MNAFVRQMAALSVVWSLCELLLPDGRQQRLARMTVSALVMAALVSAMAGLLGGAAQSIGLPAWSATVDETDTDAYARTALTAVANQAEGLCERMAERVGYQASAAVYLRLDGSLERVTLRLAPSGREKPLMSKEALVDAMATRLGVEASRVRLEGLSSP